MRRHGPLQAAQYLPLAIDLAAALHYFGRIGWVHLDVKPSNVIMGAPARLIDLSVARPLEDAARARQPIGTDDWMAPEQCQPGEPHELNRLTDIWGLGATLFHAVSGERPFAPGDVGAHDIGGRFPQLVTSSRELPAGVPAPVVKVLHGCLERRPEDRPLPSEVTDALEPVLASLPRGHLAGFRIGL
ncbi:protein kinase domain-containing protein [Nocardioides alcanivorans]|uniref:protein kinase domain-containing protein n=1 Tax=Nocardioides alcanivorans TaxID=2897352 RepID=UPI001F1AA9F6|nr:protein kinase [Nocardioides alcanivorans]